mgnify:CR=1 FL=1
MAFIAIDRKRLKSQSPQTGQFNSYMLCLKLLKLLRQKESQSPQTGQFNSYGYGIHCVWLTFDESQSPQTGQFNSYDKETLLYCPFCYTMSQSPQTGQFNSYNKMNNKNITINEISLNPLKRVNSILTDPYREMEINPI